MLESVASKLTIVREVSPLLPPQPKTIARIHWSAKHDMIPSATKQNYDIILRKRNLRERWQQQHYTVCVMSALSWVAVPRIWSPEGNTVCVTRVETRYHLEPKGVPKASIDETHQHCLHESQIPTEHSL